MVRAYVRWADGHSDKAGGALDGQTGRRAPRHSPQCLATIPHGIQWHLFPALHPHVSPTCKKTHVRTHWAHGLGGNWEKAIGAVCCVDLRISLLKHSRSSLEGVEEMERNFFLFTSFFVLQLSSVPGLRFTFPVGIPVLKMPAFLTLSQESVAALAPANSTMTWKRNVVTQKQCWQ